VSELCPSCGKEVVAGARFCRHCGHALTAPPPADSTPSGGTCSNCGGELAPEARFCRRCGTSVVLDADGPASEPTSITAPEREEEPRTSEEVPTVGGTPGPEVDRQEAPARQPEPPAPPPPPEAEPSAAKDVEQEPPRTAPPVPTPRTPPQGGRAVRPPEQPPPSQARTAKARQPVRAARPKASTRVAPEDRPAFLRPPVLLAALAALVVAAVVAVVVLSGGGKKSHPASAASSSANGSSQGSTAGTGPFVVVTLSNGDDLQSVTFKGQEVARTSQKNQIATSQLGHVSPSAEITFQDYNKDIGYSWGFVMLVNGKRVCYDVAGTAGKRGANNDDQSHTNEIVHKLVVTPEGHVVTRKDVQPTRTTHGGRCNA
jgi:hypothetical protein